jgi:hypothetical protein
MDPPNVTGNGSILDIDKSVQGSLASEEKPLKAFACGLGSRTQIITVEINQSVLKMPKCRFMPELPQRTGPWNELPIWLPSAFVDIPNFNGATIRLSSSQIFL